jgi:hypothetical protein
MGLNSLLQGSVTFFYLLHQNLILIQHQGHNTNLFDRAYTYASGYTYIFLSVLGQLDNIDSILEKKPESRVLLLTSHWLLLP